MIRLCREAGLPEPEFSMSDGFVTTIRRRSRGVAREVTPEVPPEVAPEVTREITGEVAREVTREVGRLQKYRLTSEGRAVVAALERGKSP